MPIFRPVLLPPVRKVGDRSLPAGGAPPPAPEWNDDFSTDTLSQYTLTFDSGSPSAFISGGALTISTAVITDQAVLTRNGVMIQDGYVEAQISSAADSGLVFRFQDNSTYYLLAISDDSGLGNPNLRIWRKFAGGWNALGAGVQMDWLRGEDRLIRFGMVGSTVAVSVDGVEVFTWTDTVIAAAGKVGMRGNCGFHVGDEFKAIRWASN